MQQAKNEARKFLQLHHTMVLASISNDVEPQAATIYYVCDDDFNLYFMTAANSKKAENLRTNGKVAFVVGQGPEIITIQGGGVAKELPSEEAHTFHELIKQVAFTSANQWPVLQLAEEGFSTFKIAPTWLSYLNLEKEKYPDIASKEFYKII